MKIVHGVLLKDRITYADHKRLSGFSALGSEAAARVQSIPKNFWQLYKLRNLNEWKDFFIFVRYYSMIIKTISNRKHFAWLKLKYLPEFLKEIEVLEDHIEKKTKKDVKKEADDLCSRIAAMTSGITPNRVSEEMTPKESLLYMVNLLKEKFEQRQFAFNVANNGKQAVKFLKHDRVQINALERKLKTSKKLKAGDDDEWEENDYGTNEQKKLHIGKMFSGAIDPFEDVGVSLN